MTTTPIHRGAMSALVAVVAAAAAAPPGQDTPVRQTQEVADWLTGSFSNGAQARRDPAFHHVLLHTQPIWPGRSGEHWLYVEQALADTPDKPYRQRIYRIRWEGGPVSEVFLLPGDPSAFIGAWRDVSRFNGLEPEHLEQRQGCSIWLHKQRAGGYEGATRGRHCGSDRSGAQYATSEVVLDAAALSAWDRGFDAAGSQVWGATAGPYRFERADSR